MSKRRTPGPFIWIGTSEFIIDDGEYGLPEQSEPQSESSNSVERTWTSKRLISAAFDCLANKYPKGFAGAQPAVLRSQARPIWAEVVKAEGEDPKAHPLPKWDSFKRERDRRVKLERDRARRRD